MKTVLYVGGMEFPDKNAAAQRVISNCKILKSIGYNVVAAGMDKAMTPRTNNLKFDGEYKNIGIYSRSYPVNTKEWVKYMVDITWIKDLVAMNKDKNVVGIIAYNFPSLALLLLKKYAKSMGIIVIADCTEWYGNKKITKALDSFVRMRFAHKRVGNIICISDFLEKFYSEQQCHTLNLPSLIDTSDEKWDKLDLYVPNRVRVFSYVGSPGRSKEKDRIDIIINSFFQLKKNKQCFRFEVVGISKSEFLSMYCDLDDVINYLGNSIYFHGRLNHSQAIAIIRKSDFTIFAREQNRVTEAGFPTKLAESFVVGTPVITTPSSNISKYINKKNGFVTNDCSVSELTSALEFALRIDEENLIDMHNYCLSSKALDISSFNEGFKKFMLKAGL